MHFRRKSLAKAQKKVDIALEILRSNPNDLAAALLYQQSVESINSLFADDEIKRLELASMNRLHHGDRITKGFFSRVKSRKRELIQALRLSENEEVAHSSPDGMLFVASEFYTNIFTPESTSSEAQAELLFACPPPIPPDLRDRIDSSLKQEEILRTIRFSKGNTAPGPDGLPWAFYKSFGSLLSPLLLRALEDLKSRASLPIDFTLGNIILFYKKGDPTLMRNYRPITFYNLDFNIITKTLSHRMT